MTSKLPPLPIGVAPGSGYWNDWYEKLRTLINNIITTGISWTQVTSTPTTLAGYGITDAVSVEASAVKIPSAVTDGTGALAGTLLNAPIAGNPTKWVKVDDNGTTRYVPMW